MVIQLRYRVKDAAAGRHGINFGNQYTLSGRGVNDPGRSFVRVVWVTDPAPPAPFPPSRCRLSPLHDFRLPRTAFFVRMPRYSPGPLPRKDSFPMLRPPGKRWHWSCLWAVLAAAVTLLVARLPFVQTIELKTLDARLRAFPARQAARSDIVALGVG